MNGYRNGYPVDAMAPQSPSFDDLPRHIATSFILPYVSSSDWLRFRVTSRRCYEIVHGSDADDDVSQFVCPKCRAPATPTITTTRCHDDDNSTTDAAATNSAPSLSGTNILSERLWKLALVRDFMFEESDDEDWLHRSIHSPTEPVSDALLSTQNMFTASSLFISWMHWRKLYLRLNSPCEQISGPYFLRAGSMWQKIEQWCDDEGRSKRLGGVIKSSLIPGRRMNEFYSGESRGLLAFQAVYAFYAGQCDSSADDYVRYSGLFGAYQVSSITGDTRWLNVHRFSNAGFVLNGFPIFITIAKDECGLKRIVIDRSTGQLYSLSSPLGTRVVATPCEGGKEVYGRIVGGPAVRTYEEDSFLRWFEEHANRLYRDYISVGALMPDEAPTSLGNPSLLRYPTVADTVHCSHAVTRGIEIVASAIFVHDEGFGAPVFVYSIRMRLLTPEDGEEYMSPEQRGFGMCQLVSRHWKIYKDNPDQDELSIEEVRGDGVIGCYPLLCEGGYLSYQTSDNGRLVCLGDFNGCFNYQSCTDAEARGMEGCLQFCPGSMLSPTGPVFDVRVAPFPLVHAQNGFMY